MKTFANIVCVIIVAFQCCEIVHLRHIIDQQDKVIEGAITQAKQADKTEAELLEAIGRLMLKVSDQNEQIKALTNKTKSI